MKRSHAGMTIVLGLGLLSAGCAEGDAQVEPAPTVTVTETVTATPEPDLEKDESEPLADDDVVAGQELNERGNIPVPVGAEAGLTNVATGGEYVTWTTLEIGRDPVCNRVSSVPPEGYFIYVDIEVEVQEAFAEHSRNGFMFNPPNFEILDEDGTFAEEDPTTHAANNCLDDDDKLTSGGTRPGLTETGRIVLESPVEHGYVVYRDMYSQDYYEWEF